MPDRARLVTPTALSWDEVSLPQPGWVRARNLSSIPVVAGMGELLDGGMSLRALTATILVPGDSQVSVAVEAVGGRWWDEGPLRPAGLLSPVATALLLQASLAEGAIACSARTALWSLRGDDLTETAYSVGDGAVPLGWMLADGQGAIAAWVAERQGGVGLDMRSEVSGSSLTRGGSDPAILDALRDAFMPQDLVACLVDDAQERLRVLLPRGLRLIDLVVAAEVQRIA